jgi:hypothetical protein
MIDAVAVAENRTRVPYAGGDFVLCFYTWMRDWVIDIHSSVTHTKGEKNVVH